MSDVTMEEDSELVSAKAVIKRVSADNTFLRGALWEIEAKVVAIHERLAAIYALIPTKAPKKRRRK